MYSDVHPGVVAVHGVGLPLDGGRFVVMDLVDGSDLARRPLPPIDVALRRVAEATDAVAYAHAMAVVHCDLKPSNPLLGGDGRVRVVDFGLAWVLGGDGDAPHGGTAGFMVPEQADPDGTVSRRTDVFGLGAVLRALLPERPPEVDVMCLRCLAPNPDERFASAAELASALRDVAQSVPAPVAGQAAGGPLRQWASR